MKVVFVYVNLILIFMEVSARKCCSMQQDTSLIPAHLLYDHKLNSTDLSRQSADATYSKLDVASLSMADRAVDKLRNFTNHLKTFTRGQVYDLAGFEFSLEILSIEFAEASSMVKKLTPQNQTVAKQLEYAKHTFQDQIDSAELMKIYDFKQGPAQSLILKTAKLNVKLLTMFDHLGKPDTSLEDYKETVVRLASKLNRWHTLFFGSLHPPVAICLVFSAQYEKARETLSVLVAQISRIEIGSEPSG